MFAVGPKFDFSWMQTRETYRAHLLALVDRSQRGQVDATIQQGAADVASQQLGPTDKQRAVETARDLITLPEDLGLLTALTGSRGAPARGQSTLTDAIAATLASYSDVTAYYQAKFPSLGSRPFPPTRLLMVSLTDTFARNAVEVYAELADRQDAYLVAGVNMALEWQVVCTRKAAMPKLPGGVTCAEENPSKVARLRAPDDGSRPYAYEATSDKAANLALVFDPDGKLIAKVAKAFPTPVEVPGQLDLRPGELDQVKAIDTPVGRLGLVTSRDAFMPDVVARLDQERVEILVQPEFFVNDVVRTEGMWAPDTLLSSGFSALQRLPSINALVLPSLTGNVYEFSSDAQQHIALKPRSRRAPKGYLVGQDPVAGLTQVQNWMVQDPDRPGEPMPDRRRRLGLAGEAAFGGSPCPDPSVAGVCRGGQVEGVLVQDVQVGVARPRGAQRRRKRGKTVFAVNKPVAPSAAGQRNVTVASRGNRVWAAYEEADRMWLVRSFNGGRTWTKPRRPAAGDAVQWHPSISLGPDGTLWLAWQEGGRVRVARSLDGGVRWMPPVTMPGAADQSVPSIAGTGPGRAFVAWIDRRHFFAGEDGLRANALYGTRLQEDQIAEPSRLDGGETAVLAATQDHAWTPSVAAQGDRVLVAWMDLRTYDWRIYSRESADGGATFGDERAVQDTPPIKTDVRLPPEHEALNHDPVALFTRDVPVVAWTDFRKYGESAREPHRLYDTMLAVPGGPNVQVDPHGRKQVSTYAPAATALADGTVAVAWQDHAAGPADLYVARVRPGRSAGRAVRVDDSGSAGWNQWRPAITTVGKGRVLVLWEDERDGPSNLFASYASTRKLR
jgi:predicted amidohydrolase